MHRLWTGKKAGLSLIAWNVFRKSLIDATAAGHVFEREKAERAATDHFGDLLERVGIRQSFGHDARHGARATGECLREMGERLLQAEYDGAVIRRGKLVGGGHERLAEALADTEASDTGDDILTTYRLAVMEAEMIAQCDGPASAIIVDCMPGCHLWLGAIRLVHAMGLSGISKSQVSKLCKDIDERVHAFLDRPLVGEWPYLWLDATYLKQRESGRIVSVAAIIAMAVNTDGKREIVGLHIGPSEAETFWSGFLRSLARRGLRGVKLVISDAHEGLKAAIRRVFSATWQRCRVHWMRNALSYVSKTQQSMVAAALRQTFIQPDRTQASQTLRHVADQLRQKWPKLASFIDDSETDVLSHLDFPEQHRTKIHSTNPLERLNKEVKRRADVVGIFPNEASIIRLIGAVLLEQNDEWQLQHRYMQVEAMAELGAPANEAETRQIAA